MDKNEINKDSVPEIVSSREESSIEIKEGFWWWIAGTLAGAALIGLTYWSGVRHGKKAASAEKKTEESKKEEPKKDESDKKDESSEACNKEATSESSKKESSEESNKKEESEKKD